MDRKDFLVRSDTGNKDYRVEILFDEKHASIFCDCIAGNFGQMCKHKGKVLKNEFKGTDIVKYLCRYEKFKKKSGKNSKKERAVLKEKLEKLMKEGFITEVTKDEEKKDRNQVILEGILKDDPEFIDLNDTRLCKLKLITIREHRGKDGKTYKIPQSHRVDIWGEKVKYATCLKAGVRVGVEGQIVYNKYRDSWFTNIWAEKVVEINY